MVRVGGASILNQLAWSHVRWQREQDLCEARDWGKAGWEIKAEMGEEALR